MISSREAYSNLERAISGVRRDEDRLTAMLRSADEEIAQLRAREAEAYRELAELRLDAIAKNEVVGTLAAAERKAKEALARWSDARAAASANRQKLEDAIDAADDDRTAKAEALEEAIKPVEDLIKDTRANMPANAAWKAQVDRVADAEAIAIAADEKADQAEADQAAKGKPYESDPLFIYLWRRGYGTSQYRAGPLVRYFDGKVAKLIEYDGARPNYYMLNEIPKRLRQHADRVEAEADAERKGREEAERAALEAAGIKPLEAAVDREEAALEEADKTLIELKAKLAESDKQQGTPADETSDPAVRAAIEGIAAALRREDLNALYRKALDTPTPEDEKVVDGLKQIEGTLVRKTAEAEEVRKAAVDMSRRRTELEHSEQTFRTSGYNHPFGQFMNGVVIGQIIEAVIRGMSSGRDLEDALRDGFQRRPGGNDDFFGGGVRLPRSGPWGGGSSGGSSGGRSSGGGFRTTVRMGGGSRGGGFRTTKRF